ncbi:endolytic transglycosylase MltG [Amycolatopsis sp. NPDC005232]|uniref:endolytic transglycosylase MltG n=1 Tax=Amycolatopsis sp. NPDC005232 TaxID=3157027 RepID=UPI0033ADFF4B
MTEPRGPEDQGGRRRLRDPGTPPPGGPRRARRTPPPSGAHEQPPRSHHAAPEPYDEAPPPPPSGGRRRRREASDEVPPPPQAPPPGPPPATGRRRRRDPADVPPPDFPQPSGDPRRGDPPQPSGDPRGAGEMPPPPPGPPPAGPRRRRRAEPGDVPPAPPRRRPRSDTGDLPLPGDPGPSRPVRRPGPPEGSMPPDPRFAGPVDGSMPPDPRFAGPVDGSMPPDPRFAGPVDGSMPPDPRFAGPVDGSMPPDPRFAGPPDGSMPPDPRLGRPGPSPRRRPQPVEHPTDVIPAVPDSAPQEREQLDDLFGDDDYEDEYREDGEYDQAYDDEEYGEYEDAEYEDEEYAEEPAPAKKKKKRKRSKRALGWVAALLVLVVFAGGAYYGYQKIFGYNDFDGTGEGSALIQVEDGDTTSAIGGKLVDAGVVASTSAFVKAGAENTALSRIQQGYYLLKQHMSGESAVSLITSPGAHVGRLEIRPYMQLDDVKQPGDKVAPGVYSLISKASCAELDGKSTCVSTDALRKTVADADLKTLGVPDWAVEPAQKALSKDKRIEGLIAPGLYDVKPGWTASELITNLVKQSASAIQAAGLSAQSTGPKQTPYQTLIVASLIEREAITPDFPKIARVIYNRLDQRIKLGFDSTVNYVVDKPTLLTSKADREAPGPYNTYLNYGLPPTPIGVPSTDAIKAALDPPDGHELYFVKCEKDGHSCFATTLTDHNKNIDLAHSRGVF